MFVWFGGVVGVGWVGSEGFGVGCAYLAAGVMGRDKRGVELFGFCEEGRSCTVLYEEIVCVCVEKRHRMMIPRWSRRRESSRRSGGGRAA